MVEDELLAVARTFTNHLHHAEYVRQKNLARERNSLASARIARPTDSITAMRAETKKKKEAEIRAAKNRAALENLKSDIKTKVALSDDSDLEYLSGNDSAPWVGTSLQSLMAPEAKKNLTSLTGLQGIQSSTKAAAGYPKPQSYSTFQSRKSYFKIQPPKSGLQKAQRRLSDVSTSSATSDDNDLDAAPSTPRSKSTAETRPNNHDFSTYAMNMAAQDLFSPPPPSKPQLKKSWKVEASSSGTMSSHKPSARLTHHSAPSPDFEEELDGKLSKQSETARRRLGAQQDKEILDHKNTERERRGNVNEIPIFLV
ncbi:MAG: hypothetical protein LQ351_007319 [Letrouitia transgressa]|nr:MAG: hypothetical protein LQ351_007319 [Letrouitia transgressa]